MQVGVWYGKLVSPEGEGELFVGAGYNKKAGEWGVFVGVTGKEDKENGFWEERVVKEYMYDARRGDPSLMVFLDDEDALLEVTDMSDVLWVYDKVSRLIGETRLKRLALELSRGSASDEILERLPLLLTGWAIIQ